MQTLNEITFVSENIVQNINLDKEYINNNAINEMISNWNVYRKLNYTLSGYDYNGNPKYTYIENTVNNGVEVHVIYTKIIIN